MKLKFGLIVGNRNALDKILEFATVAEKHSFDHLLLSDHYWLKRNSEEPDLLESWAVVPFLAGVTSTIKLGTCVTPITFRPPLQFAKFVSTVDIASGGRVIVGVGAGWEEQEFRMFSRWYPTKERLDQFREALRILVEAWTKKSVKFRGRFYEIENAVVEPKPLQKPHPPLWFGGWGRRMPYWAGMFGDGWIPTGPRSGEAVKSPEEYRKFVKIVSTGLRETGRPTERFNFGCRFGPSEDPKEHLQEIEAFSSAGLNCYQLGLDPKRHSADIVKNFADSVIACL